MAEVDGYRKRRAALLFAVAALMLGLLIWNPPWISRVVPN